MARHGARPTPLAQLKVMSAVEACRTATLGEPLSRGDGLTLRTVPITTGVVGDARVLSRLFRRLFLEGLAALNEAGRLLFFGELTPLADRKTFAAALARLRRCEWVVYANRPFAGPKAVLAYLSRYTHRVAIANARLIALDDKRVTFKWKDYRIKSGDPRKTMTLAVDEFIRRFLLHVLPSGFHRIRHYGLFAGPRRAENIARLRELIAASHTPALSRQHAAASEGDARGPLDLSLLRRSHAHRRSLCARRSTAHLHHRALLDRYVMTITLIRRRAAVSSPTIAFIGAWARASMCAAITNLAASRVSPPPSDPVPAHRKTPAAIPCGDIDRRQPTQLVRPLIKSP